MAGTFSRSEIKGSRPQSNTTIHGWPSVIFGIPFLSVGVFIFLLSIGVVPVDPGSVHAPMWVLSAAGLMFGLPGAFLMVHGAKGLSRKVRLEAGREHRPDKPWLWDFDWEPLGISEAKHKEVLNHFWGVFFLMIFLVPFNWWAFLSNDSSGMVVGIVGFFDLILIIVIGTTFYKLFQLIKYGNSRLRFADFPFFLGAPADLILEGLPAQMDMLSIKLRAVEEAYEMRGSGKNRSQQVVCYKRYEEERINENVSIGPDGKFKMTWDLPNDKDLGTRLGDRPAFFWEMVIEAQTPGIDYSARFLVPIYAQP